MGEEHERMVAGGKVEIQMSKREAFNDTFLKAARGEMAAKSVSAGSGRTNWAGRER